MLSDAQWAELDPLIEECRLKAKTPPQELRRTIYAILWRHQNGAKWRALPKTWALVAGSANLHPLRAGVWERLLDRAQERDVTLGHGLPRRQQRAGSPEGVDCGVRAVRGGRILPTASDLQHVQDAADDPPVIDPRLAGLAVRQMGLNSRPNLIREPEQPCHRNPPSPETPNPGKNARDSNWLYEFPT